MSDTIDKIKHKALPYLFAGLSLFGGVNKVQAQQNGGNIRHSVSVEQNEGFIGFFEELSVTSDNKTSFLSNDAYFLDLGNGYKTLHETTIKNNKTEMTTTLISPDGRKIDISFYNTKDFMLPRYFEKNNPNKEITNDPTTLKENNDRWEQSQRIAAMKEIKNPQDREAFYMLVKQDRKQLEEGGFNPYLLKGRHIKSVDRDMTFKDSSLSKEHRKLKREMTNNSKRFVENALRDMHNNHSNS